VFRGQGDVDLSEEATVLKLFEHDIGGHALHFMVSLEGVLRLESVFMKSSPPEFSRSDVREWLNRVEDDFADNHRVVELANPVELPDTSWRCPLHWLQTFSNDGTYDDHARAPVPTRNSHFALQHCAGVRTQHHRERDSLHEEIRKDAEIERMRRLALAWR
jgi:hypothetical protein